MNFERERKANAEQSRSELFQTIFYCFLIYSLPCILMLLLFAMS